MASNRAKMVGDTLVLPAFTLFKAGSKSPHRHRKLATHTDDRGRRYEVIENWPGTQWWAYAVKSGFRMSNTATTSSKETADEWAAAVAAGDVSIAGDDMEATGKGRIPLPVLERRLRRLRKIVKQRGGSVPEESI